MKTPTEKEIKQALKERQERLKKEGWIDPVENTLNNKEQ